MKFGSIETLVQQELHQEEIDGNFLSKGLLTLEKAIEISQDPSRSLVRERLLNSRIPNESLELFGLNINKLYKKRVLMSLDSNLRVHLSIVHAIEDLIKAGILREDLVLVKVLKSKNRKLGDALGEDLPEQVSIVAPQNVQKIPIEAQCNGGVNSENVIRLFCPVDTVLGFINLMHEVGHIQNGDNEDKNLIESKKKERKIVNTLTLGERARIIESERLAWAYALQKSRGFFKELKLATAADLIDYAETCMATYVIDYYGNFKKQEI